MALNWKTAQKNEKKFWEDIFVNEKRDDVYSKSENTSWEHFTLEVIKRHKININILNEKTILDLGSGPAGVAKGLEILLEKNILKNLSIIAVDPLMDFYKNEIRILKESRNLKLLSNKGENIDIPDNSIDIIFSTNVLDHCENPDEVIKECFRILKPGGLFLPSLHLIYDYLKPVSKLIKYVDKNHPNHFVMSSMKKKFNKLLFECDVVSKYSIREDQTLFSFKNIFKSRDKLRALKRYLSNYVLYTCYFFIKKK
mgnify:CR=1 FL=1|tara:strand:+ start:384 stop:1148 length:765 start_codon:yes stop_codon:yes gene_type:complete